MSRSLAFLLLGFAACRPAPPANARVIIPAEDQGTLHVLTPSQVTEMKRAKAQRNRPPVPVVYVPEEDLVRGVRAVPK